MAEETSFLMGALVGFIAATILGMVMQRIRLERGKMGAHHRTQAVTQQTSKTPAQVVQESRSAALNWFFWMLVLIAIAVLVVGFFIYLFGA